MGGGRALRKPSGDSYWTFNNSNLIILRPALQQALLRAAGEDLPLTLGSRCTGVRSSSDRPTVILDDTATHEFDLVIGADGVRSGVRAAIAPEDGPVLYSGSTAWRAVVHAPGLVPTAWLTVGRGLHFLAAPLPSGNVYWSPLVKLPLSEVETIDDQLGFMHRRFEDGMTRFRSCSTAPMPRHALPHRCTFAHRLPGSTEAVWS